MSDDESFDSPAQPKEDDEMHVKKSATSGPKKSASEMYQKVSGVLSVKADAQLSQLEHVLKRPDTYIGSVEAVTQPMWVYDHATNMMVNR